MNQKTKARLFASVATAASFGALIVSMSAGMKFG